MAQIGVKKRVFFKKIFFDPYHSRKVPGGSGTLKNAKLTLHGPKMGPFEAILCVKRAFWPQKTPFWGQKNAKFSEIFFCSESLPEGPRRVWDPQKPNIKPPWPQIGPVWAHFVGKMDHFRVKTAIFSEIFFHSESLLDGPWRVWDPQKSKIKPPWPPIGPLWGHFVGKMGHFGVKNAIFSKNFIPNRSCMVPGGSSSLKPPKLRLHCP